MAAISEFIDNGLNTIKKLTNKSVLMAGMMLSAPLVGQAQTSQKEEGDKKGPRELWMYNVGASITPDDGAKFDFHGVVPGVGQGGWYGKHNLIRAGARLTGRSMGGSVTFRQPGRFISYYGWTQQFSTAYLDWLPIMVKKDIGNSTLMAGAYAQAAIFPGNQSNWLNTADGNFGITGMASLGLGKHFALTATANLTLAQLKNPDNWNRYWGNSFATDKQINPAFEIKTHLSVRPNHPERRNGYTSERQFRDNGQLGMSNAELMAKYGPKVKTDTVAQSADRAETRKIMQKGKPTIDLGMSKEALINTYNANANETLEKETVAYKTVQLSPQRLAVIF